MTHQEKLSKRIQENLKDHVAERIDEHTLRFKAPASSYHEMHYRLERGLLVVSGDVGCAVYQFASNTSFEEIAQCNIGYFASKCTASPHGITFRKFNPEVAVEQLDDMISSADEAEMLRPGYKWLRKHIDENTLESDWRYLLGELEDEHPIDAEEVYSVGMNVCGECHYHLAGLKMVFG